MGQVEANFKHAFPGEQRFTIHKGQKGKHMDHDYWTKRLAEVYAHQLKLLTLICGRNRHAVKYLAFLLLRAQMRVTEVTLDEVLAEPIEAPWAMSTLSAI